ncbi:HAD family hydrolase [Streptococcus minor]|uniref:HAD family hydrolase n=1 Tax=Streptococcus minor TaxID=229549 RepID=UPI0003693883|nr:HAD-IA family hydrolase [Streptococcus minor]
MIEWLFFDIGSTLVDEGEALDNFVNHCIDKLAQEGILVSHRYYYEKLLYIAKLGGNPIYETWSYFAPSHLKRPRWSHENERLYPYVTSVLRSLRKKYHLGIIANQGKDLHGRLERFGILDNFEVIKSSFDSGVSKPDMEIFRLPLEQANIEPSRSIYIGDRVDNDMVPAKKLGMKTIRMKQGLGQYSPEDRFYPSDWQVASIQELLEIV